jgi:hypothetical protein
VLYRDQDLRAETCDLFHLRPVAREAFQRDSLVHHSVWSDDRESVAESGRKPAVDGASLKPLVMADRINDMNALGVDRHLGECAAVGEYRSRLAQQLVDGCLSNMRDGNTYRDAGKPETANLACFVGAGRKDSDARRQHGAANLEKLRLARHESALGDVEVMGVSSASLPVGSFASHACREAGQRLKTGAERGTDVATFSS